MIDATHGGLTLSEAFAKRGHEVTCVDVYGTLKPSVADECSKTFQVRHGLPSSFDGYDLIVAPVHHPLPRDPGGRVVTHHEAVKMLVGDRIDFPVVEVTGSFGKTTSIRCAISLLRERHSVLSLMSGEVVFVDKEEERILMKGNSTTPANVIKALELCPRRPDLAIFEVSLGGTGLADLGVIKNVYDNYPIGKGTSCALEAKLSMVRNRKPGGLTLLNADDPSLRGIPGSQYFSTEGRTCEVRAEQVRVSPEGVEVAVEFRGFHTIDGPVHSRVLVRALGPVGRQHVENLVVGISVARFLDGDLEGEVEVPRLAFGDRMVMKDPACPLVLNRSPAVNEKVLERSMRDFLELFPPTRLEVGGRLRTTCGRVSPEGLARVINRSPFGEVFPFGEMGEAVRPLLKKPVGSPERKRVPTLRVERA